MITCNSALMRLQFGGNFDDDDEFQLAGYQTDLLEASPAGLAARDPDAEDRVELSFDEDAEIVTGRQEEDMLFDNDSDRDDVDIWVSPEAESFDQSLPVNDFDDLWNSSQSTLDVCILL